ncbi:hypothetical protein ACWENR_15835 [Micromonospora sp. NPDC004336]
MTRIWTKEAAVGLVVAGAVLLGPAPAAWAGSVWEGPARFGQGDDGTPSDANQPLEKGTPGPDGGAAGPGAPAILGGVLLPLGRRGAGDAGAGGGG